MCPPSAHPSIPKIFHQIWIDFGKGKEPTEEYRNLTERLIRLHPGWRHILWYEKEIIEQISAHVPFFLHTFKSYDKPVKKHDSARFVILYALGGVYLDHDFIPIKSIEPALGNCRFIAMSEPIRNNKFMPANGVIGSVAKNPFLLFAINLMNSPKIANSYILEAAGPDLMNNALKAYGMKEETSGFRVYHPKFFNPIRWTQGSKRIKNYTIVQIKALFPECIFVQFFQADWLDQYKKRQQK